MKKILALTLIVCLFLSGCAVFGAKPTEPPVTEPPTEAPTAATEPPTTEPPTEPQPEYFNPLNGEPMFTPYEGRIVAVPISNVSYALPHYGTMQADILMEMWVNGSIIRDIALFTDISRVPQIGSVRSVRMMFNQIIRQYDAILLDAGGDDRVTSQSKKWKLDRFNIDTGVGNPKPYSFRDTNREFTFQPNSKLEHCLFINGEGVKALCEAQGFRTTQSPDKDYFLRFAEDGTPAGTAANSITVTFTYNNNRKDTTMVYDADLNKYIYHQYGKDMIDGATGEPECFNNVIVMLADITMNSIYYVADFPAGGKGFYACGGKIIPITWTADGDTSPFRFYDYNGNPLVLNMGNTYIAVAPKDSPVVVQ